MTNNDAPYVNPWRQISRKDQNMDKKSTPDCNHKLVPSDGKLVCDYCGETFKF
jgi:uncharacterized Zn finger protein (UPF0148 family)